MFSRNLEDSFSEGVIYPGRALVVFVVLTVFAMLASSI
jgi:hypothetical protein